MKSIYLSYLCLASSMLLIGVYVGLSKPLANAFPVLLIVWLRYGMAIPPLIPWFKRQKGESPMTLKNALLIGLGALIGSFAFTLCTISGIKMASALSAGVIMAGIPAAVALLSFIFLKERITLRILLAIMCAVIGIALLAFANFTNASENTSNANASQWLPLAGQLLLILGVFCEATYVVIAKQVSSQVSPKRMAAYFNLWGWLFSMPCGVYLFFQFDFSGVHWQEWGLLIFYTLSASIFSVWLWMTGVKNVPASSAGIFTIMLPIAATIVGIILGEHFSLTHGVAFLLALLGIVLATWPKKTIVSQS